MEIPERIMKFKFYIISASLISLLFLSLLLLAPRFVTILSYFWPLFVSTALFLFAVVFFARVSPLNSETSTLSCEKAGEGLLDYVVAGQPENTPLIEQIQDYDDEDEDQSPIKSDEKSNQKFFEKSESAEETSSKVSAKVSDGDHR